MSSQPEESFFKAGGRSCPLESGGRIERQNATAMENGNTIGEKLDFREGVRSEKKRSGTVAQHMALQELTKRRGGDGVQTARWLIEKQDAG